MLTATLLLATWFSVLAGTMGAEHASSDAGHTVSGHVGAKTAIGVTGHASHLHCPLASCTSACVYALAEPTHDTPPTLITAAPAMPKPAPATVSVFPELPPPQLS